MIKKLKAKVQQIKPELPKSLNSFAGSAIIEPESKELLLKKGVIYAAFDISASDDLDTELVTKLVSDVLHDSYFSSESISPIQSLEKAISDVKGKVSNICLDMVETGGAKETATVEFNISALVLWGNVIYIVMYGEGSGFLVKRGEIRPINKLSEGNFSTATGIVAEGDVFILCNDVFAKKIPPEQLLNTSISIDVIPPHAVCLILKFEEDATLGQDENIRIAPEITSATSAARKIARKASAQGIWAKKLSGRLGGAISKRRGRKVAEPAPSVKRHQFVPQPDPRKSKSKLRSVGMIVVPVVVFLLAGSIALTLLKDKIKDKTGFDGLEKLSGLNLNLESLEKKLLHREDEEETEVKGIQDETAAQSTESAKKEGEETIEYLEENTIKQNYEALYDVKIVDSNARPTSIAVVGDSVVVADKVAGTLFVSDISTPKFEALESTFAGIESLMTFGSNLGFNDKEGYKLFDLQTGEIVNSYPQEELNIAVAYLDFIYSLRGDKILKYIKEEEGLAENLWMQDENLMGAKDMDIAVSIYVLDGEGKLRKYTSGIEDEFEVDGLETPFKNPVQVLTAFDFDHMYVADSGNRRVVVMDKKGAYVKQFAHEDAKIWDAIKGIGVNADESKLFVLSGSKIFEVDI